MALASRKMLSPAVEEAYGAALAIRTVDLGGHFYLREDPPGNRRSHPCGAARWVAKRLTRPGGRVSAEVAHTGFEPVLPP